MAAQQKTNSGLETRHIFLDTEVYRRYGHNLNDKVLRRLLQVTKDHISTLHITDITIEEINRQLGDTAAEVAQAVNKGNRLLKNWRHARLQPQGSSAPVDLDAAALAREAVNNFKFIMTVEWQPTRHDAMSIPAKTIFGAYFRRAPPFDKADSKEFPDAFIVAALDSWCQKEHEKMYVVTKDKAMLRAVEQTKTLLPLPTLEDYLALFVDDPTILEEVKRILSSAWDIVEENVRDQLLNLGTSYTGDLHDGEVIDHEAGDGPVKLIRFDIISASDDQIEVVAKVNVPITFDVQHLDTSSAWWDSENKEFVGGEPEVEKLELELILSVLINIDPRDKTIAEVSLLTRNVNVREPYDNFK